MTKEKVKKMDADRKRASEKQQAQSKPSNTGLGKDLLNNPNPIK